MGAFTTEVILSKRRNRGQLTAEWSYAAGLKVAVEYDDGVKELLIREPDILDRQKAMTVADMTYEAWAYGYLWRKW